MEIVPDLILPEQYFPTPELFQGRAQGERRLLLAILQDALECIRKYAFSKEHTHKKLFREAEEWISSSNPAWLFSFDNICTIFNLNPDYIRSQVERWKKEKEKEKEKDEKEMEFPRFYPRKGRAKIS